MSRQVKCPNCNKRLFDINTEGTGAIGIKCPKCKQIINISLN